jgi:hypothetical protein
MAGFSITLYWLFCYGQNTTKKKHFEVIISLEKQFNIKFSYAVDVANIAIEKPNTFTLQETIDYLNSKTLLNFKALDDRYVTVSVLNKTISVCGIVSDEKKSRLVGASVFVNNIGRSTITDGNGTFKLQYSIHATLTISYVDLNPDNFRLTNYFRHKTIARKLFFLQNEELNQVLIQVYLTSGLQKYLDGSTVLNTKNLVFFPD